MKWPKCQCPDPDCSLKLPPNIQREREEHARTDEESAVFSSLRERVREDIERRHQFGTLGRLL
ncbi:hypothetical protein [Streptomyces sp. NPDC056937]|uniref:hypothetical protein n=1 Tax=Streptomyces sp. NPDC056937 TaxID=3345969 RepID=UPI00362C841D